MLHDETLNLRQVMDLTKSRWIVGVKQKGKITTQQTTLPIRNIFPTIHVAIY